MIWGYCRQKSCKVTIYINYFSYKTFLIYCNMHIYFVTYVYTHANIYVNRMFLNRFCVIKYY